MFEDFSPSKTGRQSRRRFGGSVAAAVLLYGTTSAAIVVATASVQKVVEEQLTQVDFAPPPAPPEPPPPPPPPEPPTQAAPPVQSLRPKVKRPELAPPKEVPHEKPAESDKPLTATGEAGPVDGFLNGVEGGKGIAVPLPPRPPPPPPPPPPPLRPARVEPLTPPVEVGSTATARPKYSASARRKGIEGTVIVAFDVLEDGSTANAEVMSGPQELREGVLKATPSWRFKPARRGSQAVRYRMRKSVVFRLEDA